MIETVEGRKIVNERKCCARSTYAVGVHLRVGLAVGDLDGPQANTQGKDIVQLQESA